MNTFSPVFRNISFPVADNLSEGEFRERRKKCQSI